MDHASAFVESIVESPDDETPRLIFADWLDDSGQPDRAEFIRLQIARSHLHPADPLVRAHLRREADLLARHEADWLGPLAVLVPVCRFHRGFVEEISLAVDPFLRHGNEIFSMAPIRRLHLRGTSALPTLLADSKLTDHLADLLRRLRVLDLNRESLSEPAGLVLLNLPKLPRLEGLHLSHNGLTPAGVAVLAESPVLSSLTTLEFNTGTSREHLEVLLQSPNLRQLEHLALTGTREGDRAVSLLHGPGRFPHLRSLALGHTNLSPDGLLELLTAPVSARLESLDVSFNRLEVIGARHLARYPGLDRLTWLNLSRTRVGDDGASLLADSPLLSRLRGIDLSLNRIDDDGGRALADHEGRGILGTLDLIYNPLGAEVREVLRRRFGPDVCLFTR